VETGSQRTDSTSSRRRWIRRIIAAANTERGGAAAEFLLALATGRLRLRRADLDVVLSADPGNVAMVRFLHAVCRQRLTPTAFYQNFSQPFKKPS